MAVIPWKPKTEEVPPDTPEAGCVYGGQLPLWTPYSQASDNASSPRSAAGRETGRSTQAARQKADGARRGSPVSLQDTEASPQPSGNRKPDGIICLTG